MRLYAKCIVLGWMGCVAACASLANAESPLKSDYNAPVIPFEKAAEYIGQDCTVFGIVVEAKSIGSRCFLNFHPDYRNHFTVVINRANFDAFPKPPHLMYKHKKVKVFGRLIEYAGTPEIIATSPDQITIIEEFPEPCLPKKPKAVPATNMGSIRIASFNVLNMFDGEDCPFHGDESTPAKSLESLEKLADTIRKINADVLALEEVENRWYLERFVEKLLPEMGYRVVLFEGNDYRGIDNAVLSRLPIGPVTSYRHLFFEDANGKPMKFNRDLLQVRINPPKDKPFDIFVVHLKSKGGGEAATKPTRMGEAKQIRAIFDEMLAANPKARFVITGDFNDTFDSDPVKTIIGTGESALFTFVDDMPKETITYNQEPHKSMIDFMFASPAMGKTYVKGSAKVFPGSPETTGSDHNPLYAEFGQKAQEKKD